MDIANHRLFNYVGIKKYEIDTRSFLQLSFANNGIDAINLGNILHHKSVIYKIPPYFKNQSVPIISMDMPHIQQHMFHDLNIDDFKSKPPDCACSRSPFIYNPAGQVITGDLNIIINTINTSLRDVFAKELDYRETKSISQKHSYGFRRGQCQTMDRTVEEWEFTDTNYN